MFMVFLKYFSNYQVLWPTYKHFFQEDGHEDEGKEHDAFELFQMCQFSKKKGYIPAEQLVIVSLLSNGAVLIWIF